MLQQSVILRLILMVVACLNCSWSVPGSYKTYDSPKNEGEKLDYVVVEVNGDRRLVNDRATITVLRGDKIKIVNAMLLDRAVHPKKVNLVGFSRPNSSSTEDRGYQIETLKLFDSRWAVDENKKVFAVTVFSEKKLHGAVFLKLEMPTLKYVDLIVNKKLKVIREGEVLVLAASDKIKVQEIRTNIIESSSVKLRIVKLENKALKNNHLRKADSFEIQFNREGLMFAKIPMLVEGL